MVALSPNNYARIKPVDTIHGTSRQPEFTPPLARSSLSKIVKRPSSITKRIQRFATFGLRPKLSKVASFNGLFLTCARIPGPSASWVGIDNYDIFPRRCRIFVRSGYVNLPNTAGTLRNAGINADYWSSRADAATNAYNLNFNATAVNPSNGPNNRWHGFPLRCLISPRGCRSLNA